MTEQERIAGPPVSAVHRLLRVPRVHCWPLSGGCSGATALPPFTPFREEVGAGRWATQSLAGWLGRARGSPALHSAFPLCQNEAEKCLGCQSREAEPGR